MLLAGWTAAPAAAVTFGAAVFTPVSGPPFVAAGVVGLAPVAGAWAMTLTRTTDTTSPRFRRARINGVHFKTLSLAWVGITGDQTVCLGDVAVTSYATRTTPGGGVTIEHATLFFGAARQTAGLAACARLGPAPPVAVRLFTDPGGALHARVDCLIANCNGVLRVSCRSEGCPRTGLRLGTFTLDAGQERVLLVPLRHTVRGRHPQFVASIALAGHTAPLVSTVTVDPRAPRLPTLVSTHPSLSPSPAPQSALGNTPPQASGTRPAAQSRPDSGPDTSGPGPPAPGGSQVVTALTVSCDGPTDQLAGVHGVLDPGINGRQIEINYVPADPNVDTVIHNATTGAAGRFSDVAGIPFIRAVVSFAGDDSYLSSEGFCP